MNPVPGIVGTGFGEYSVEESCILAGFNNFPVYFFHVLFQLFNCETNSFGCFIGFFKDFYE